MIGGPLSAQEGLLSEGGPLNLRIIIYKLCVLYSQILWTSRAASSSNQKLEKKNSQGKDC